MNYLGLSINKYLRVVSMGIMLAVGLSIVIMHRMMMQVQ